MESENRKSDVESKEQVSRYNELVIDLVRHGESKYTNSSTDLTELGKEQIRNTATNLAAGIESGERIVIWSSPAPRAKFSSQIIKQTLENKGIGVIKEKEIGSLRPIRIDDLGFVLSLYKEVAEQGRPDTAFMTHPEFAKQEHEKMETRPQVEKRIDRVLNYLRYLAEHVDFQGQPMRMILVSHFEIAEPITQEVFGNREPFLQAENLEIKIRYDKESKNTEIYFSFRGEEKGPFGWDKQGRKLTNQ